MRRVMWSTAGVLVVLAVLASSASAQAVPAAYGKRCQDQSKQRAAGQKQSSFARCVSAMARLAEARSRSPKMACSALPRKARAGSKKSPYGRCVQAGTSLIRHGNGIDRAFVDAMTPHHVASVRMARIAQSRGQTAFVRGLATSIVTSHDRELAELRKMAAKLKTAGIKAVELGLTRAERGLDRDPAALAGANPFDLAFVDMMIAHHQAAITMSKVALGKGVDKEARELAGQIVSALAQEIAIMQNFRTLGPGSGGPGAGDLPH